MDTEPPPKDDADISVLRGLLRALRRVPLPFLIWVTPVALWVAVLPTILAIIFFGGGYLLYRWMRSLRQEGEELADW